MTNSFYNPSGTPGTGTFAASAAMRTEFDNIAAGFDKLPTVSGGTASKAVIINSGGTGLTVTAGTLALAGNFATVGAFALTLTVGAAVNLTLPVANGTLATLAGVETLSNKTLVAPALGTPVSGDLSNCTGAIAGNLTGVITSVGLVTSIASQTGTGSKFVVDTSPTLVTPILGVATATSINKVTITAPASNATLTIANTKTLTVSNTLTLAGTDGTVMTFPAASGDVLTDDSTATLTNKTISGASNTLTVRLADDVTGNLPVTNLNSGTSASNTTFWRGDGVWATPSVPSASLTVGSTVILSGTDTRILYDNAGVIGEYAISGTGSVAMTNSPAFTTPNLGTPSAGTLTNCTLPLGGLTGLGTGVATWLATPSSANLAAAVTGETGTGALVFGTSPTLTTPNIGVATATSINGLTISNSTGTLLIANAKTLTANNSLTLAGTDGSTVSFGAGGTVLYSGGALGTPASGTLTNCTGLPAASVVIGAFADGMQAATQTLGDNSLLIATTQYVDRTMGQMRVQAAGYFQAGGGATPLKTEGITSITRNSAGRYTVVMSSAAPTVNYLVLVTSVCDPGPGTNAPIGFEIDNTARTTTTFEIGTTAGGSSYADSDYVSFVVYV